MISAIFNKKYVIVDDSLFIFDGNNIINVGKVGNILIYENKLYSFSGKPIIIKNKAELNEEIENKKVSFVYDLKNDNDKKNLLLVLKGNGESVCRKAFKYTLMTFASAFFLVSTFVAVQTYTLQKQQIFLNDINLTAVRIQNNDLYQNVLKASNGDIAAKQKIAEISGEKTAAPVKDTVTTKPVNQSVQPQAQVQQPQPQESGFVLEGDASSEEAAKILNANGGKKPENFNELSADMQNSTKEEAAKRLAELYLQEQELRKQQ